MRRAVAEFGGLDGAYNGAGGVSSSGAVQEIDEAEWRADIDANLTSVFLSLKHELPAILRRRRDRQQRGARRRRRGRGHVAERRGQAWGDRLARAVALECADRGVRVNALVTGTVDTPLLRRLLGAPLGDELDAPALNPAGRVSEPEEIAALVAFLLSDESRFITGAALAIDGGFTAQ